MKPSGKLALIPSWSDLLRHGKQARAPAAQPASPVVSNESSSTSSRQRAAEKEQQRAAAKAAQAQQYAEEQQRQAQQQAQQHQQQQAEAQARAQSQAQGVLSPQSLAAKEAAEYIVKEEREAKNKMPVYAGLENFKLLEKMGEWVSVHPSYQHRDSI